MADETEDADIDSILKERTRRPRSSTPYKQYLCSWMDGAEPQWVDEVHLVGSPALEEWETKEEEVPEVYDSDDVFESKMRTLAKWLSESKRTCILTGAGLSAPVLPTFRGARGLWTTSAPTVSALKKLPRLGELEPTLAHYALVALERWGTRDCALPHIPVTASSARSSEETPPVVSERKRRHAAGGDKRLVGVKKQRTNNKRTKTSSTRPKGSDSLIYWLASQNYDGFHVRSGFPPEKLSELHGNIFKEYCTKCGEVYYRSFEVEDPNADDSHKTGRSCDVCDGSLRDNIIHFGESLPHWDLTMANAKFKGSDLCIVLGSSLLVTPASLLPFKVHRKRANRGKVVIVNLQDRESFSEADLVIHAKCDRVMEWMCDVFVCSAHRSTWMEELKKESHARTPSMDE